MSSFRIRPRFSHTVEHSVQETQRRLVQALATHSPELEVKVFPDFVGVHIGEAARRYWSPRLFLSLQAAPAGGTLIEGIYGPEIEVWGVFLYGYLITGLLATFAGIFGCAQLLVKTEPWAFWVVGTMAVLAGLLYLGAQFGQKLGAWQTFQLHQAYQTAIGLPAKIE
jgi:hypothetical protein